MPTSDKILNLVTIERRLTRLEVLVAVNIILTAKGLFGPLLSLLGGR